MESYLFGDRSLFELVVEASPAAMVICDSLGKIVLVNDRTEEYFGYSRAELIGSEVEMLIPFAHRGGHYAHRARFMSHPHQRSMNAGRDLFACRKDGSEFPVDISLHPIETSFGTLILANILDATDRFRAKAAEESRQSMERLALLGQLAGGVAHEIRTPLCVIGNAVYYLQMLAQRLDAEGVECLNEITREVAKANRIVSELLDFTRDSPSHLVPVSIGALIHASVKATPAPGSIRIVTPQTIPEIIVSVDHEQIERILINLIRNACESILIEGIVGIEVRIDGPNVWIDVVDNGPGVSAANQAKVFEPLFTTRAKGIGLGLAVSRRYAHRNGGTLTLISQPDQGARFRLALPIVTHD